MNRTVPQLAQIVYQSNHFRWQPAPREISRRELDLLLAELLIFIQELSDGFLDFPPSSENCRGRIALCQTSQNRKSAIG